LGGVNRSIRRFVAHGNFEQVASANLEQPSDVKLETVERTLMQGASRDAVDLDRRVRHDALEHEENPPSSPVGGDIKTVAVVGMDRVVGLVLEAVTEFPKAL